MIRFSYPRYHLYSGDVKVAAMIVQIAQNPNAAGEALSGVGSTAIASTIVLTPNIKPAKPYDDAALEKAIADAAAESGGNGDGGEECLREYRRQLLMLTPGHVAIKNLICCLAKYGIKWDDVTKRNTEEMQFRKLADEIETARLTEAAKRLFWRN